MDNDADGLRIKTEYEGSRSMLEYIFSNDKYATIAIESIKKGNDQWLNLFPLLKLSSDASISLRLDHAIGYAISNNPKAALEAMYLTQKNFENKNDNSKSYYQYVCSRVGGFWAEEIDDTTRQSILDELENRIVSIKTIDMEHLCAAKSSCLNALNDRKRHWTNWGMNR